MNTEHLFKFEFSLEILNHLGRGLYRSFATVIAEAISNSWDAEATEVHITTDDQNSILTVEDNGKGMNDDDFQNKFLKVGYSRRGDKNNQSKRIVIGRKGIGKLAMLSISRYVKIISKEEDGSITGGVIQNSELDKAIKKDNQYSLGELDNDEGIQHKSGTKIIFKKLKERMNSEEVLRKYIATQFNFLFNEKVEDEFKIFINGNEVTENDLKELNEKTQFIWLLGGQTDVKNRFQELKQRSVIKDAEFDFSDKSVKIQGFIASVEKPKNLVIRGSKGEFKAGVNLFCNGRLRQENILQEITSKRVVESYLYGEVHVDDFDREEDSIDRFTSSREGIIKSDPLYQAFLKKLRDILNKVLDDWDKWRVEEKQEGDIENERLPEYKRRLIDSKNFRKKDFQKKIDSLNIESEAKKCLKDKLKDLSESNTQIYQDLFILENLYREYINNKYPSEDDLRSTFKDDEGIDDTLKKIEDTKKHREEDEERHHLKGKVIKTNKYSDYLDLVYLGILIDKINSSNKSQRYAPQTHEADTKEITPVRNAVMHTNEITEDVMQWEKIKNVIDYMEKMIEKNNKQNS